MEEPDFGGGKVSERSLTSVEVKFMNKASLWRRQGSRRKTCSAGGEVHGGSFAPPEVGHPEKLLEMTHLDVGYIGYRNENKTEQLQKKLINGAYNRQNVTKCFCSWLQRLYVNKIS